MKTGKKITTADFLCELTAETMGPSPYPPEGRIQALEDDSVGKLQT